jgi:two-component system, OmpR family, osmolarity sensor histidine kinase EnvZ
MLDGDDAATIGMDCDSRKDKLIINIADHNQGILENEIDRLLRPLTRLDIDRG